MTLDPTRARTASHTFRNNPALIASALLAFALVSGRAETCTTQSGMSESDRTALAGAARTLALEVQSNDAAALRTASVADVQQNFNALQYLVAGTAPKLAGATATVDQVYLLDASTLKRNADGSAPDAQFFCSLNRSTMEADFLIPQLPPGRYSFVMVDFTGAAAPFRLSFLLRQEPSGQPNAKWLLAGFYPKPLTAASHDGLWYWTQARQFSKDKQPWNAWLTYQAAAMLLRPADFVLSSHLDKLRTEASTSAPPALSDGISADTPLVVKSSAGVEYRFTALGVDDSLSQASLDVAIHLRADPMPDPAAARKRNADAMAAFAAAFPEIRKPFHGIWMYAESPGQPPFATEQPMADIK